MSVRIWNRLVDVFSSSPLASPSREPEPEAEPELDFAEFVDLPSSDSDDSDWSNRHISEELRNVRHIIPYRMEMPFAAATESRFPADRHFLQLGSRQGPAYRPTPVPANPRFTFMLDNFWTDNPLSLPMINAIANSERSSNPVRDNLMALDHEMQRPYPPPWDASSQLTQPRVTTPSSITSSTLPVIQQEQEHGFSSAEKDHITVVETEIKPTPEGGSPAEDVPEPAIVEFDVNTLVEFRRSSAKQDYYQNTM
jgi:hypothetical protein